jgi:hypothetical protein
MYTVFAPLPLSYLLTLYLSPQTGTNFSPHRTCSDLPVTQFYRGKKKNNEIFVYLR